MSNRLNRLHAEWSSWQLVGLITQRSSVRVRPPQHRKQKKMTGSQPSFFYSSFWSFSILIILTTQHCLCRLQIILIHKDIYSHNRKPRKESWHVFIMYQRRNAFRCQCTYQHMRIDGVTKSDKFHKFSFIIIHFPQFFLITHRQMYYLFEKEPQDFPPPETFYFQYIRMSKIIPIFTNTG